MTPKQIDDSNKLIALFMGATADEGPTEGWFRGIRFPHGGQNTFVLKYHNSWDWIMPVLEKIESHGCIVEISMALTMTCRICLIGGRNIRAINIVYQDPIGLSNIDTVYKAVVEFVTKYYNN